MANLLRELCAGATAGFAATTPMTVGMDLLHQALPPGERDPLPPRHVTDRVANATAGPGTASEQTRHALTMLAHFGYGAAAGSLYGPLSRCLGLSPVAGGVAYGLGVWAAGYFGWLPAAGLYRPPHREPAGRHLVMLSAHVLWGVTLGLTAADLLRERSRRRISLLLVDTTPRSQALLGNGCQRRSPSHPVMTKRSFEEVRSQGDLGNEEQWSFAGVRSQGAPWNADQ